MKVKLNYLTNSIYKLLKKIMSFFQIKGHRIIDVRYMRWMS